MYSTLMYTLRLVKKFHDIGILADALDGITTISEDDYYELILRGFEHVAPIYDYEDLGEEVCCGGHYLHHFSDPAIPEYYRLCRLYEHGHSLKPMENPYVRKADAYYISCFNKTSGDFATNFDDESNPKEIWIETCPKRYAYEEELIEMVHDILEFFRSEVEVLRAELLRGPVVWLPALPAPATPAGNVASRAGRKKKDKAKLRKAS